MINHCDWVLQVTSLCLTNQSVLFQHTIATPFLNMFMTSALVWIHQRLAEINLKCTNKSRKTNAELGQMNPKERDDDDECDQMFILFFQNLAL